MKMPPKSVDEVVRSIPIQKRVAELTRLSLGARFLSACTGTALYAAYPLYWALSRASDKFEERLSQIYSPQFSIKMDTLYKERAKCFFKAAWKGDTTELNALISKYK